jgi:hypothetical protein
MLPENPFKIEGRWYKGNLHTHTTNSDGAWAPDRVVAEYISNDYDFLFITDHGKVTDVSNLSKNGFLVLNGSELGAGKAELGQSYHLLALNLKEPVPTKGLTAQEAINEVKSRGGEVIVAHPYWSGLTFNDIINLEGHLGIEVFNTTCFNCIGKGHSAIQWDDLLARKKQMLGFAVDDTHQHFSDFRPIDICSAWIMVKLPELTEREVMKAIIAGRFYASNGPAINDISIKDGKILVKTSEAKVINFIVNISSGESHTAMGGKLLTEAEYRIRGSERYVRVECFDKDGKTAWSNAIIFNE